MSVAIMTDVWKMDIPTTEKVVLLALADAANDDGVTWIAVASRNRDSKLDLQRKTSLSERAVQGAIKRLCAAGHLSRTERPGKGVIYQVNPRTSCGPTPAPPAPRSKCAPAANDVDPRSSCGETVNNHQLLVAVETRASPDDRPAAIEGEMLPPVFMDGPNDWPAGDAGRHAEMLVEEAATVHLDPTRQPGLATTTGRIHAWRRDGASWEHDVLPVVRAAAQRQRGPIRSWKFFDAAIAQSIADNRAALMIPAAHANADRSSAAASAGQSARRENRERASAGAGWASEVMAARRSL